jgi:hypothetical protein
MAKLTDADGPELVRLLNALMDAAHRSLVTDIDIHYRTPLIGQPDPHEADQGWSVRMGVLRSDTAKSATRPTVVDALQSMVTQLAHQQRQRDIAAAARPKKRKR